MPEDGGRLVSFTAASCSKRHTTHATANIQLRKRLRSADTNRYEPFTTRLNFGKRSFSHAGPKARNALPAELQDLTDHSAFKRQFKTFLFERAFTT